MKLCETCEKCSLCKDRQRIVWGDGPENAALMFIAEAPGEWEDKKGIPFWPEARAGLEFEKLLTVNQIRRENCYVTNFVKCRPYKNRDPHDDEIKACSEYLNEELRRCSPKIIVPVGRFATRFFLPMADMEQVHGIPHKVYHEHSDKEFFVVPVFHPAAGLRSPEMMMRCQWDFKTVAAILRGELPSTHKQDRFAGNEHYNLVRPSTEHIKMLLQEDPIIAVDTETVDGEPWSLQFSTHPGTGYVIKADNIEALEYFRWFIQHKNPLVLIHNTMFDLPVLEKMGVYPKRIADTMVMAYLLQSEPQGLKPLAFRHCGMEMTSYEDMIGTYGTPKMVEYLVKALEHIWPDPMPQLEFRKDGRPHIKQPQNISKKITRMLKDFENPLKEVNLWDRWKSIDKELGRAEVEAKLGPMPQGSLQDVWEKDQGRAIYYSAKDADATFRLYPYLWSRIQAFGLQEAFEIDMGCIPMAADMQIAGIKPDLEKFKELSTQFEHKILNLESDICKIAKHPINPSSPDQVKKLLFKELKLRCPKRTLGTNDKILARMVPQHKVVQLIRDYRTYTKLKGTYTDALPKQVAESQDGRIHTTIRVTRTATGRLSSASPNLMQQPVRTEEGKEVRNAFVSAEGTLFCSADFVGIEMRVAAHLSQDERMLKIFREGKDLHAETASAIFGIPVDQLDKMKHRYPAKRVGFGILYGITAPGLREHLIIAGLDEKEWTFQRTQELINAWFDVYKGVKEYMERTGLEARRLGYVKDMWGRIRFIPYVRSADEKLQAEGLRQAGNMPVQSGAQGIIKKAMGQLTPLYKKFQEEGYYIEPIIQIHDDLMFEVGLDLIPIWIPLQQSVMENVVKLAVPTPVDPGVGSRWGMLEPYSAWTF